ncbi:helix-turn-helix domain-containing protein [Marinobacterium sp. AK62]|uniref:Helix-turn-helix domain-containing protein n=1 Tax=Marinobacterium alkalitolerans TaxID=1542925 RepID=A0ABS3Z7J4_9GAMM|nr:helix-turn-helix domain-containing protein [Marinobacterium alkalitolerans]
MKNTALLEWAKTATDEQVKRTKTTRGYLRQIAYGNKTASAELASRIEKETFGSVTRKQLRPDDWRVIWPELSVA